MHEYKHIHGFFYIANKIILLVYKINNYIYTTGFLWVEIIKVYIVS